MAFTHLHVHTHYSLLDGACKIPQLVKRVKALGMDSVAITDHGCMFGVIEFFSECKKEGIRPILGMEAYMAPGDRRERSVPSGNAGDAAYHLLLLAENLEGYHNLLKLASTAYRDGFYYKPRIDKAVLLEHNAGLIATSACLGGEIPSAFLKRDAKNAKQIAETYLQIFGPDRFFIELQKQGIREQDMVNPELAGLAKRLGVGTVATNDVHFLEADDHHAHDVLCCISMGRLLNEENRLKYPTALYLKSPQEMAEAMADYPEALDNTGRIAAMCDVQLDFSKRHSPVYRVAAEKLAEAPAAPAGKSQMPDDERYLRHLCEQGLESRFGSREVSPEVRSRLEYELSVITSKNFCSYFLIVWDFCNFARSEGIPVGARGSGVGTMVGYLLGLSNVDPLRYNLLFERFMDPNRSEMPDIDIDICQDGRQKVIDYVREKYGHVAQIITFGTLAAKAACKDVGRVMGVPLAEIDQLTKLIPGTPGMSLEKALAQVPELKEKYDKNLQLREVIDIAKRLEGMCRNAGCHAAGVIIADEPLEQFVPLYRDSDGNILTQFEGPVAEKVGLLKMDFLGLRTLTALTRAVELERQTRDHRPRVWAEHQPPPPLDERGQIDIEKIDLTDKAVLALFCRGETKGIFQFESGGMQDLLMKMQPDRLEDLIAANALYRPGPMELIPLYCSRKHGRESVPSIHPIIDRILEETYGIMVYQEQVMQIFNQLGGIDLSSAYKLIKAISKKQGETIAKFRAQFIAGTTDKGVPKAKAEEIFEHILKFGGYGFNKSHSTRYAIVAFQTAYMKTYHPVEYMAAVLTFEMGSTEKVVEDIEECRRLTLPDGSRGVTVLPPDVNVSDKDFTPIYVQPEEPATKKRQAKKTKGAAVGVIRFGLAAVRGVGEKAVETIAAERRARGQFASIWDFCDRIDLRAVSRATTEALVKCGAFSSTGASRAQLLGVIDRAVEMGQQSQQDKRAGQLSMFAALSGAAGDGPSKIHHALPNLPELTDAELLKYEKELLGFYITSHPLTEHQATIDHLGTANTREAALMGEGNEAIIGGMISRVKKSVTKTGRSAGQQMAMITLTDTEGQMDGVIFAETFAEIIRKHPDLVANERIVFVRGKIDKRRETPSIVINDMFPVELAPARLSTWALLKLEPPRHGPEIVGRLMAVLDRHKGSVQVYAQVSLPSKRAILQLDRERSVRVSPELTEELSLILGPGQIDFHGEGSKRRKLAQAQRQLFAEATIPEADPEPDLVESIE